MGEVADAFKRTGFWLALMWLPLVGLSVLAWIGGVIPVIGVVLPFSLTVIFGLMTGIAVCSSGMLQEERDKGDAGMVSTMMRASTQSLSQRKDQGLGSSDSLESGSARMVPAAVLQPAPATFGQMQAPGGLLNPGAGPVRVASDSSMASTQSDLFGGPNQGADIGKWQVCMDHDNWVDFEGPQQSAFSTGLLHGLEKVEFTVAHQRYELVFADGVQRNVRSGKSRRVRCVGPGQSAAAAANEPAPAVAKAKAAPPTSPPPAATALAAPAAVIVEWQVQMDTGNWIDMDGVSNAVINDAKERGDGSAFFRSHNQDYELSFSAGTQKNVKTNKERPIRVKRIPGGAAAGGAAGGAVGGAPPPLPAGDSANPADETARMTM